MKAFDVERARFNMVEQQIRTWDVLDPAVLDLLFTVKREEFVPPAYRTLAFADLEIPLGGGQRMWSPKMEARVLQELAIAPGETVLEIGTGSGYFTALLAARGALVTSVEIDAGRATPARSKLARHGFSRARVETGDGARGWGRETYDVVVLTGSTPLLPEGLVAQVKPGGRMFAVVGEAPVMKARLLRAAPEGALVPVDLFETVIPALVNALLPERFVF
ncbi:MAG: protein-L-isoaspartate O-methyltransferase [Betaproteobacteria bacterium]|nr:MAG: protein-L-isoaspartate O-methyltransferase [Betaproteobacteria bacterium]